MRGLPKIAFLALLAAACTVTTTGAPCTTDLNCPSDQGCGANGLCSTDALSCPGHTEAGQCRPGTSCSSGQLVTCTATSGVCSTGPVAVDCPANQACSANGGEAACLCAPSACSAATSSFCDAGGQVVTCAQDGSNALGCWYEASAAPCTDPGTTCTTSGAGASCTCPVAGACTVLDATTCDPGGAQVLRCSPVVAGSSCLTWQPATDCSAAGLACRAGACACPENPGPVFVADAVSGSAATASPAPTGVSSPASCRFRTLTDALGAANARGPGSIVRAAGWTAAGGTVSFAEPGAIAVGEGVTLATDDATPTPAHYAVATAASLPGPFVTLRPGSSISGLELRNATSTGAGVETACAAPVDAAAVALSGLRIVAAAGSPAVRFAAGVRLAGHCPTTLASVVVEGAATGIAVEAGAASVESTAAASRVTGSTGAAISVAEGKLTFDGGTLDGNATGVAVGAGGTGAPAFSATGTTFSGNAGDAAYVARGTFTSDACPYARNGTHVHAQPVGSSSVNVTVRNSSGAAAMTGATNSAFRLLAVGSGSTVVIAGNAVTGNDATQSYNVASGLRRGGGMVITAPFAGSISIRGNSFFGNKWDQVLVAAGTGSLDFAGGTSCGAGSNSFGCYDASNPSVGLYSNGASIAAEWNRWSVQPGVFGIDVGGSGVTGFDTLACAASALTCQ